MKRGRPIKHLTNEDRLQAIKESKTRYMTIKEWRCPACGDHNYTLAGKHIHMKTKKHIINCIMHAINDDENIQLINDI